MYRTIYSKSSNDRSDRFKVITKIQANSEGEKIVKKVPASDKSIRHISAIAKNYNLLAKKYDNTSICFAGAKESGEDVLIEYVEGKSFEEYLDKLIENGDIDLCIDKIKVYFDDLFKEASKFECTSEFIKVFGEPGLQKSLDAVELIDIDMLFGNVIYGCDKWTSYDYEWTFDFKIPKNFIIYRIMTYFVTSKSRQELCERVYKEYGITEEERSVYSIMEENFQNYICEANVPMWKLYSDIHGRVVDVKPIAQKYVTNHIFQVYYDFGEGYSEADSAMIPVAEYEPYKYKVDVKVPDGVKTLRIDPLWSMGVIVIDDILDEDDNKVEYITNGCNVQDRIFFFHNDPQIFVTMEDKKTKMLRLTMEISSLDSENELYSGEVCDFVQGLIAEKNGLHGIVEKLNADVAVLNANIEALNSHIAALTADRDRLNEELVGVYNSTSWKLTKPLRKTSALLKK